ncbi:MAG TPA: response regulator transcription factor [Candidatus Acidoferrales bacterium]|nr:response regulator transcription factor [Candidatus Acidoferrales bacterium]
MRRRILIADDHEVVRKGLKSLLAARVDWQVCGEASSGLEAIEKSARLEPDVIVMDISMPNMDGLQATRGILQSRPEQKIVLYTMHDSEAFACAAMRAGAQAAVGKSEKAEELFHAIDLVLHGQQFFPAVGLLLN